MKQIKLSRFKFALAFLIGSSLLLGSLNSCTREDLNSPAQSNGGGKSATMTFSATTASSATKSGDAEENFNTTTVSYLTSEQIGEIDGMPLYLNSERTLWEDKVIADTHHISSKTLSYTSADELKTKGLGFIVYQQESSAENTPFAQWTLWPNPAPAAAIKATYNTGMIRWIPESDINWPNMGKYVRFIAYAPYDATINSNFTFAAGNEPKIENFELNTANADQVDLLYANSVVADAVPTILNGSPIPYKLTFKHALAAIRFKVVKRTPAIEITKIKISGVYDKGTFNMATETWEPSTLSNTGKSYELTNAQIGTLEDRGDANYLYFKDDLTFMMIPALPNSGAQIELTLNVGGSSKTITTDISSHEWAKGYAFTYVIDNVINEDLNYTYTFSATTPNFLYNAHQTAFRVTSYKTNNSDPSDIQPVGWIVDGYYTTEEGALNKVFDKKIRNGIAGTFISSLTPEKSNGSTLTYGELVQTAQVPAIASYSVQTGNAKNAIIASATPVGTTTPYNLAGWEIDGSGNFVNNNAATTTIRNTANTYIINGPGYYRFPLVMGNGIKNGSANPQAYNKSGFTNYLGQTITTPYLTGTGDQQPFAAYLEWQSINQMISIVNDQNIGHRVMSREDKYLDNTGNPVAANITNGISRIGSVYWVNFYVPTATEQGLAHIAVINRAGEVMWSWLIWLTDYQLGVGDQTTYALEQARNGSSGRLTVRLMPRNLGYVDNSYIRYYPAAETFYLRLLQNETGRVLVIPFARGEKFEVLYTGYNTAYQWGRYTPLANNDGRLNSSDPDPRSFTTWGKINLDDMKNDTGFDIATTIKNPSAYIINSGRLWNYTTMTDETIRCLWNAGATDFLLNMDFRDSKVIKTIYDPCPVGYTVPRANAFTAFIMGEGYPDGPNNYYGGKNSLQLDEDKINKVQKENYLNPELYWYGWSFYGNWRNSNSETPSGDVIFFPYTGRHMPGQYYSVYHNYTSAYYWTAGCTAKTAALAMYFYSFDNNAQYVVYPRAGSSFVSGNSIRPQREE